MQLRLFGSATSPYVRRVRVALSDLEREFELVDVFQDEGQAELRRMNPLWKVPTLALDDEVCWDSEVILDRVESRFGRRNATNENALLCATVDEVLGTLIKAFYLRRDGVDLGAVAYLQKDQDRVRSTLRWLDERADAIATLDRAGLVLFSALDWIRFREVVPLDDHRALRAFLERHQAHPLLAATDPRL